MISTICTGPIEPSHLMTWLQPLVDSLLRLSTHGVEAIDGTTGHVFNLKAHACLLIADAMAARQVL